MESAIRTIAFWGFLSCGTMLLAGCSGESAKELTADAVGGLVERGKGVAAGIEEGADRGRENVAGSGGARTITRAEEIHEHVSLEVLQNRAAQGGVELVVAFGSDSQHPLHVAGLRGEGNAVLLDEEGFAMSLNHAPDTVEIPAQSKVRVVLRFQGDASKARKLRLWGEEMEVPAAAEAEAG